VARPDAAEHGATRRVSPDVSASLPDRPAGAQRASIPSPEERAAQLAREERLTRREVRWAFARTLLACFAWLAVALLPMGWALHTTDFELGHAAFLGGMMIGYGGIAFTLGRYYLVGEERGWW
jgi:hypothetical protein